MLPFTAQGAAQAIEDAASLAAIMARSGGQDISQALRLYACVRLSHTARIQALARHNKQQFHLPDGPEQQERDAQLASGATGFALKAVAWLYGHDAADIDGAAMRLPAA